MPDTTDIKNRVAMTMRAGRRACGMTQEALAAAVDCSVETLSNAERGQSLPSLELFFAISRVLEIDVAALIQASPASTGISRSRMRLQSDAGQLAIVLDDRTLKRWIEIGKLLEQE